jgi:hypothetical protein
MTAEPKGCEGFMGFLRLLRNFIARKHFTFGIHPVAILLQSVRTRCPAKFPDVFIANSGGTTRDIDAINKTVAPHAGGGKNGRGKDFVTRFDHRRV